MSAWQRASTAAIFLAQVAADMTGELLGDGLPTPNRALQEAGFVPDRPGVWCKRCGSAQCAVAAVKVPRRSPFGVRCVHGVRGRRIVRLGAHHGPLRQWVIAIKHNQWPAMGERLGALLGAQVTRCCAGADARPTLVVPVPMPWIRRLDRGIDHARCIAQGAASELRVACVQPLSQVAHGSQVHRTGRMARLAEVDRFKLRFGVQGWRARRQLAGRVVLLVDDVRTTGATLALTGRALRDAGAAAVLEAVLSVSEATPEPQPAGCQGTNVHDLSMDVGKSSLDGDRSRLRT